VVFPLNLSGALCLRRPPPRLMAHTAECPQEGRRHRQGGLYPGNVGDAPDAPSHASRYPRGRAPQNGASDAIYGQSAEPARTHPPSDRQLDAATGPDGGDAATGPDAQHVRGNSLGLPGPNAGGPGLTPYSTGTPQR
jgi:hypothetical protein